MILTKALDNAIKLSNLYHTGFSFIVADNIEQPNWTTIRKYRLSQGEFVKRYLDELTLLGVSFGTETRVCSIDIDRWSKYHPAQNSVAFKKLQQTLEKIGIVRLEIIQSSHSGGIHIIIFLPKPVNTFRLAALLHVTLINAGFEISKGQLENFPNPKAYGSKENPTYYNALRLPLQPQSGSLLLDQEGNILLTADNLTDESRLAALIRNAEASMAAQDIELLERKLGWGSKQYTSNIAKYQYSNKKLYSEVAREWKENLELTMAIGWQRKGQTNSLLPTYIAYGVVFMGLKGTELAQWMHTEITNANGYSEYCQHQHEIDKVIQDWVKNTERQEYYVEYCGFPERTGLSSIAVSKHIQGKANKNERNESVARTTKNKIITILETIGELPQKIMERIAIIQNKCQELFGDRLSKNTLYKREYKDLWQLEAEIKTQTITQTSFSHTSEQIQIITSDPKSQSQTNFSHTPPIYETFSEITTFPINATSPSGVVEDLSNPESNQFQTHLGDLLELSSLVELEPSNLDLSNQLAICSEKDLESSQSNSELLLECSDTTLVESECKSSHEPLPNTQIFNLTEPQSEILHEQPLELIFSYDSVDAIEPLQIEANQLASEIQVIQPQSFEPLTEPNKDLETISSIQIGTKLRRNALNVGRKTYSALSNCEVISTNGLDWVVRDPSGDTYNVSHSSFESGEWDVEQLDADLLSLSPDVICQRQDPADLPVRLVTEVARDVRVNASAANDELLSEFLNHPLLDEIQAVIALADELIVATSREEIHLLVQNLSRPQKLELWQVMNAQEQIAVTAMMQPIVNPVTVEIDGSMSINSSKSSASSILSHVTTEVVANSHESINHIDLPVNSGAVSELIDSTSNIDALMPGATQADLPSPGTIVRTLTGLVGVVRHIFQNLNKRFLVYHSDIDRAILYGEDELFFAT
jgi:hypothetical protein